MTSMAAASTAPAGVPVSLPTGIAASTPAGVASNLKHAGGGPQVTTAHALALLPTLYSAYPAAAAAAATGSAPPGLFSFFREINFTKGPSINYVRSFLRIFDPPPPCQTKSDLVEPP